MSTSEEEREIETADVQVAAFFMLVAAIFIGYCYHTYNRFRKIERFFPHASANMIFGVIVGAILSAIGGLSTIFSFNSEIFFIYLLPPIIFSAGYNLPKDFFFHNFGSIMTFAFIGTTLSAFFIGTMLYIFGVNSTEDASFPKLDFTKSMMMGSLISAVDPVAVILVLKSLSVDEQLKVILFGESVLNDAASVVINRVFVSIEEEERTAADALALAIPEIIGISFASFLIGVVCALLVAFVHKRSRIDHHKPTEMASFLLGAFIPYAIAESLDLSGIMAVLFAGIIADFYTSHHLSKESQISSRLTVKTLASLCESFVFIYLGMSFFVESAHDWRGGYMIVTLMLCFFGRALSVFPLAWLLNCGRKHKIPFKHQVVLWYSGLRGPVAYALAVATPEDVNFDTADNILVSTTLFIVAFTTLLLGGFAFPFLKCLKVPLMDSTKEQKTDAYDISNHWFNRLDRRYLKPLFGPTHRVPRPETPMASNLDVGYNDTHNGEAKLKDGAPIHSTSELREIELQQNKDSNNNDDEQDDDDDTRDDTGTINDDVLGSRSTDERKDNDNSRQKKKKKKLQKLMPWKIDRDDVSKARVGAPSFLENPREFSRSTTWSEMNPSVREEQSTANSTLDLPMGSKTATNTRNSNENTNVSTSINIKDININIGNASTSQIQQTTVNMSRGRSVTPPPSTKAPDELDHDPWSAS